MTLSVCWAIIYRNTKNSSLNPSFSGWPSLGVVMSVYTTKFGIVLIPLLVDDPLWDINFLLSDVENTVLIPLLVDDPLWVNSNGRTNFMYVCLNPSFSGWPSLGSILVNYAVVQKDVLIPLLVDDPLWANELLIITFKTLRLNPSFSGWPSLGQIW